MKTVTLPLLFTALFFSALGVGCSGSLDVGTNPDAGPSSPDASPAGSKPVGTVGTTPPDGGAPAPGANPDANITGTLDGASFTTLGALAYRGDNVGSAGQPGLLIRISNKAAGLACDLEYSVSNSKSIRIELPTASAVPTTTPLAIESFTYIDELDGACNDAPTHPTAATLTLSSVTGSVTGTVTATFPTGSVTGSFNIPLCPSEPQPSMFVCPSN